jgi:hypothetical protein
LVTFFFPQPVMPRRAFTAGVRQKYGSATSHPVALAVQLCYLTPRQYASRGVLDRKRGFRLLPA